MTISKFELYFRMQCVRSRRMDGMMDVVVQVGLWTWWCAVCTECMKHATLARCLVQVEKSIIPSVWVLGPGRGI